MNTNESIELVSFPEGPSLNNDGLTIVLIEHHLEVVMEVCQHDVLNLGTMLASGTPDEIQKNPDVIKAWREEEEEWKIGEVW